MKNPVLFGAYLAYFVPLAVGIAALITTDIPTPFDAQSLDDAVFRQQLLGISIVVVAVLHLVFGVWALRAKLGGSEANESLLTGTSPGSTLLDAYLERSQLGLFADLLIFIALWMGVASTVAIPTHTGCKIEIGAQTTGVAYCGGVGVETTLAAGILAIVGNLFCVVNQFQ